MDFPEKYQQPLIDELCEFIRIPSRSSPTGGEEGQLQSLMAQRMREQGLDVQTFTADDLPEFKNHPLCHGPDRDYTNRPTVVARLGPPNAPAMLLLAHSDTVQIRDPETWSFDPFAGIVRDDRILGLGAADDKWGLAVMLTLIRHLVQSPRPLNRQLIFASTIDEEHGVGNGATLLTLTGVKAQAALYLDGTGMRVGIGTLGGSNLILTPVQPLSPQQLAHDEQQLQNLCRQLSQSRASFFDRPYLRENPLGRNSVLFFRKQNPQGPFFAIGFYTVPADDPQEYRNRLEAAVAAALGPHLADYQLSYRLPWFEPVLIDPQTPIVSYITHAFRRIRRTEPRLCCNPKQDSFVLNRHARIPTVSFGPAELDTEVAGRGAAHQPDEYLGIAQLWQACQITWHTVQPWLYQSDS